MRALRVPGVAVPVSHLGAPVFYGDARGRCCALLLHVYVPAAIDGLARKRIPFAAYSGSDDPHVTLFTGDVLAALCAALPTPALDPANPYDHDRSVPPTSYLWMSRV